MAGRPTNRLVAEFDKDGVVVEFVDLTPEEYAAQPTLRSRAADLGIVIELSEEQREDPHLRTMASECAIHGLTKRTGHVWGE